MSLGQPAVPECVERQLGLAVPVTCAVPGVGKSQSLPIWAVVNNLEILRPTHSEQSFYTTLQLSECHLGLPALDSCFSYWL